jgi:hypothetical protein
MRREDYSAIAILNTKLGKDFVFRLGAVAGPQRPAGVWTARAMDLSHRQRPLRFHKRMKGLTAYPTKIEGFEVYRLESSDRKTVSLVAPALNFLAIVRESVHSGRKYTYHNIQIGEQAPELFEPPPGAEVLVVGELASRHARPVDSMGKGVK